MNLLRTKSNTVFPKTNVQQIVVHFSPVLQHITNFLKLSLHQKIYCRQLWKEFLK